MKPVWKDIDGIKYCMSDYVLNFALFKREVFDDIRWDNELKIMGEHTDFYLRLKETKWKVAYTPDVRAIHQQHLHNKEYREMRKRYDFLKIFFDKWKVNRICYPDGFCYGYNRKKDTIKNYRRKLFNK